MKAGTIFGRGWPVTLLAWGLAGVFGYAGVVKALDLQGFAQAVGNYRLLPPLLVTWIAVCLPWWELGAAIALLWPGWRRSGALLVAGFSGVFSVAIGSAWVRGLDIACGCFGSGSHGVGLAALALDLACLAAAGAVWVLTPPPVIRTTSAGPARPSSAGPGPG